MKIGVSSYSFSRYMKHTGANYFKICDLAREMGFDGIEFIDLDTNVQPAASVPALAADIRAHCDSIGLPIAAYTVHADFIDGENEVERLKRQVDVAQILGAPVMRHDVTWRRDIPWREIVERTRRRHPRRGRIRAGQGRAHLHGKPTATSFRTPTASRR